jgi:hypothetical protein
MLQFPWVGKPTQGKVFFSLLSPYRFAKGGVPE